MDTPCPHEHQSSVGDVPLADPTTYDFLGRFDIVQCDDCLAILSQVRIDVPEQP
jgi:hypothetical protein